MYQGYGEQTARERERERERERWRDRERGTETKRYKKTKKMREIMAVPNKPCGFCGQRFETRMTASVLKQDPTHKRLKITLFIRTKAQSANFRGNLLCQGTKRHLNNS